MYSYKYRLLLKYIIRLQPSQSQQGRNTIKTTSRREKISALELRPPTCITGRRVTGSRRLQSLASRCDTCHGGTLVTGQSLAVSSRSPTRRGGAGEGLGTRTCPSHLEELGEGDTHRLDQDSPTHPAPLGFCLCSAPDLGVQGQAQSSRKKKFPETALKEPHYIVCFTR